MRGAAGLALVLALGACGSEGARDPRPDLVLVLSDDQRFDTLGCTGSPVLETPQLDRLAREGVRFDDATVPVSLCCPSRASLLTGLHAHELGVWNNFPARDPLVGHTLFPELLQRAGYETAFVGKWHLPDPGAAPYRGFDHWAAFEGQGEYFDPVLNVDGAQVATQGYTADVLTDHALAWLRRPRERPRFLYLSFKNCHHPYGRPPRHVDALAGRPLPLPESLDDPPEALPEHFRQIRERPGMEANLADPVAFRYSFRAYLETVLSVDDNVGRIVAELERQGRLDDTAIVFTSDNGFLWGEHGLVQKIRTLEPSIRVPLVARGPGFPAGRVEDRPVLNLDLPATFLDLAGVAPPPAMRGRSLLELWRDGAEPWRDATVHHDSLSPSGQDEPVELALRAGRWKYLHLRGAGRLEEALFDLERDPGERHDLARDPAQSARLAELRARLQTEMAAADMPASWLEAP